MEGILSRTKMPSSNISVWWGGVDNDSDDHHHILALIHLLLIYFINISLYLFILLETSRPCVNFVTGGTNFLLFLPLKVLDNVTDIFLVFFRPEYFTCCSFHVSVAQQCIICGIICEIICGIIITLRFANLPTSFPRVLRPGQRCHPACIFVFIWFLALGTPLTFSEPLLFKQLLDEGVMGGGG